MITDFFTWTGQPSTTRGIHRAVADGWQLTTYEELRDRARSLAERLLDSGIGPGDVVSIIEPKVDDFLAAFFAVLLAGATPNPIAPPFPLQGADSYRRQLVRLLGVARPATVYAPAEYESLLEPVLDDIPRLDHRIGPVRTTDFPQCGPTDIGLLQFTSGSSGTPKAVRVPLASLQANIADIFEWLSVGPDDHIATWLPAYHDMGLIGCLLAPTVAGLEIDAMAPIEFLQEPQKWLSCFGTRTATIGAAPNFALSYLLAKVDGAALAEMDFGRWHALVVGAERIDPAVLRRFATEFGPYGFRSTAICPAYGLAEATLAVSGVGPRDPVEVITVEPGSQQITGPFDLMTAPLTDGRTWLVGCGRPVGTVSVHVGEESPGTGESIGELCVTGPNVALGYRTAAGDTDLARDAVGSLATGDAVALVDNAVYPIGRIGDAVKIRATTVYAEDVEAAVVNATGVPSNRVVALAGTADGRPQIAILLETADLDMEIVDTVVRAHVGGDDARIRFFHADSGLIERTTSGKPRRRRMWQRLIDGELDRLEMGAPAGSEA
ncbi:AMP-binding protein [Nocardia iowensis]|uniref:AMP-binding protein n=1 Tax=Nocardia iowensis TaxID=204891 RepID=A0ABX8RHZ4_NOCIO|nr:AMP-binding protein [Nocardia iowensis]QXN88617.1 AMP-binding protein [Nocardia iowensis]